MGIFDEFMKGFSDSEPSPLVKHFKSLVVCSECGLNDDYGSNYCIHCGHKLKKIPMSDKAYKKYCVHCGEQLEKDDCYCGHCGSKVIENKKIKVCAVCGEWCGDEKYCWNCGHDNSKFVGVLKYCGGKKCPNCNEYHDSCYNYCDMCGAKLE